MDEILLEREFFAYFELYGSALSDRSIQVENNTNKPQGLSEGWARPLNRGDRLIELRNYSSKGQQISGLWKPTVRYRVTA